MWHHTHNATTKMFENLNVFVKRFPYGAYVHDKFFLVLQNEFPVLLMLSFICIELVVINSIALEKERKLKVTPSTSDTRCFQNRNVWKLLMKND